MARKRRPLSPEHRRKISESLKWINEVKREYDADYVEKYPIGLYYNWYNEFFVIYFKNKDDYYDFYNNFYSGDAYSIAWYELEPYLKKYKLTATYLFEYSIYDSVEPFIDTYYQLAWESLRYSKSDILYITEREVIKYPEQYTYILLDYNGWDFIVYTDTGYRYNTIAYCNKLISYSPPTLSKKDVLRLWDDIIDYLEVNGLCTEEIPYIKKALEDYEKGR